MSSKFDCSCRFFPLLADRSWVFEEEKSSGTEWGNSLEFWQRGWGKVSNLEAPPLSVLLGWVVSRGEQTSCCIADEEDVQSGHQRSDSHGTSGSEPGYFPPRHEVHHNVFACTGPHINTPPPFYQCTAPHFCQASNP